MDAMGLLGEEVAAELLGEEAGRTDGAGVDEQAATLRTMSTTLMSDRDRVRSASSSTSSLGRRRYTPAEVHTSPPALRESPMPCVRRNEATRMVSATVST